MVTNITSISFDELVAFLFDHPPYEDYWYFKPEWEYTVGNKKILIQYLTNLFRNPSFLLEKYSPLQLEHGFWFMVGPEEGFMDILWDTEVPWEIRKECIESMEQLYEKLFKVNSLITISDMWWDLLTYEYHKGPKDEDDARVQQTIFEVLTKILKISCADCQHAALHGLGHLNHSDTKKAIDKYLQENRDLKNYLRDYALEAREGHIV